METLREGSSSVMVEGTSRILLQGERIYKDSMKLD